MLGLFLVASCGQCRVVHKTQGVPKPQGGSWYFDRDIVSVFALATLQLLWAPDSQGQSLLGNLCFSRAFVTFREASTSDKDFVGGITCHLSPKEKERNGPEIALTLVLKKAANKFWLEQLPTLMSIWAGD